MKVSTATGADAPNLKLILHFDVQGVLRLEAEDKDLFIYQLCAQWMWGKLERNSKEEPEAVTGWKIASNSLSQECPEPDLVSYYAYLVGHVKPNQEERVKLLLGLAKGPAAKVKAEIEKCVKNVTIPKTLLDSIREGGEPQTALVASYKRDGKYVVLPAFYKLIMALKKAKREFAIIIHNKAPKDNHQRVIEELNSFFLGEHPLYSGRHGTPQVKMDGSKGTKNCLIEPSHLCVMYSLKEKGEQTAELYSSFGTLNVVDESDPEMFRQKLKSLKGVRLCSGTGQIYSAEHSLLAESACVYCIDPVSTVVVDPADYLTHEIQFTSSSQPKVYSCLGGHVAKDQNMVAKVSLFEYLKDVDYLTKQVERLEQGRAEEILKIQKSISESPPQEMQESKEHAEKHHEESDAEYLRKHILPVLQGALKQVDLFRPDDPIGFIALYCLKNKDRQIA